MASHIMRQVHIKTSCPCTSTQSETHIHARRRMRATNSSTVSFTCTKSYSIPQNTHLPNLKHSSNTLHYSVLYQSINNHAHTPERAERAAPASAQRLPGSKVGPPCEYTNIYKGLCARAHMNTHRRSVTVFKSYLIMLVLASCCGPAHMLVLSLELWLVWHYMFSPIEGDKV